MSATNTTTNYGLPIFIETDKPAWLVDFNGAMRSIDSQMKVNADAIATKSPILTFNDTADIDFTKSGNTITANLASAVSDKVGRALVTPIAPPAAEQLVSINNSGAQNGLAIGTGLEITNNVLNAIDLNLTDITTITTLSGLPTGVTVTSCSLTLAVNASKTVGKIYGVIGWRNTSNIAQNIYCDTGLVVSAPDSQYVMSPVGLTLKGNSHSFGLCNIRVETNGHLTLYASAPANDTSFTYIFPCLYFFKDFGDEPLEG